MATKASYLERYLAGEHEQVWADLQGLGVAVREEPLYGDALAIARETMRRVRENLETLIPRLIATGYQFGYGWIQPSEGESFGWRQRLEYIHILAEAKVQPPILTIASDIEERLAERRARLARLTELGAPAIILRNEERVIAELETQPRATTLLGELERQVGALPLSLRAWYEIVGGVNLVGAHSGWMQLLAQAGETDEDSLKLGFGLSESGHPMHVLEPLYVLPLGSQEHATSVVRKMPRAVDGRHHLAIMPNGHEAYLEEGQDSYPYEIEVPCAEMDAPLLFERHGTTFVDYLRVSLRWAGFPGWERMPSRPERDIATLTEGLLPF